MEPVVWILGGLALLALLKPREYTVPPLSLGEGYMDSFNIVISPTLKDISTEIDEPNVDYPLTLDPGLAPTIVVPVNYYETDAGTYVFCRIKDTNTGVVLTKQKSSLILYGGNGSKTFQFSGVLPGGDWNAVMPNAVWNLTIECGISWI